MGVEETVLDIVWPEDPIRLNDDYREGRKVIQMLFDGKPTLLIGNIRTSHANLLKWKFLIDRQIPFDEQETAFGSKIPCPSGARYHMVGAGRVSIDTEEKLYCGFNGASEHYGIGIDDSHAQLFEAYLQANGWTLNKAEDWDD